jgi:predicted membrane protein
MKLRGYRSLVCFLVYSVMYMADVASFCLFCNDSFAALLTFAVAAITVLGSWSLCYIVLHTIGYIIDDLNHVHTRIISESCILGRKNRNIFIKLLKISKFTSPVVELYY